MSLRISPCLLWLPVPPMATTLRSHVLRRFEIYLAASTALFLIVVISMFLSGIDVIYTGALAFAGMLSLQVAIQWADRERQRRLRAKAIHDIREMLQDRILNQLTSIKVWISMTSDAEPMQGLFDDVDSSIDEVADMVADLSEEQLDTWQLRYANSEAHHFSEATMAQA